MTVHADQVTDNPEGRENHDIDRGMAVKPEEMLKRDRVAVVLWIENSDVHRPFRDEKQKGYTENGSGQYLNDAGSVSRP